MDSHGDRDSRSSRASDSPGDTMNDVYAAWRESHGLKLFNGTVDNVLVLAHYFGCCLIFGFAIVCSVGLYPGFV